MNFLDLKIKKFYCSLQDDIINNFFNPVLKKAVLYQRAVGFFSSTGIFALNKGILNLIEKGGHIELIISPQLSDEDLNAIKDGFYRRNNFDFDSLIIELKNFQGNFEKNRLNFLSSLIATNYLKIKIATVENGETFGRFNEKMGLIYDADGNIITFSGSMNESANGFTKNYDSIDVFKSWTDDIDRIKNKQKRFNSLWNNEEVGVIVSDFDFVKIKSFSYSEMTKIKNIDEFLFEIEEKNLDLEKIDTILARTFKNILNKNPGEFNGIATGLTDFDRFVGGLKKSELIILAARPSMGKTALALNIAMTAAINNNVLFFSLEMGKDQLIKRILSSLSNVDLNYIYRSFLTDENIVDIISALEYKKNLKLFIDDNATQTLNQIRIKSKNFKQEYGLDLIIIDYVQLIQGSKKYSENRVQEVSEISRGLKILARELDIPILVLSQLSRNIEHRENKRPQLSDLRESGSLEQDADIVMFLYRDEYYNSETYDKNLTDLIIAKNRNGSIGSVELFFSPQHMKFYNIAKEDH